MPFLAWKVRRTLLQLGKKKVTITQEAVAVWITIAELSFLVV
jgi:hypothetical protein